MKGLLSETLAGIGMLIALGLVLSNASGSVKIIQAIGSPTKDIIKTLQLR